jgi:4-methyl-5(b-hydroxyethyl)-thiazole monophosphate biosynthesis
MKGLMILYNNFEDCEALVTRALLMKNNFEIITATPNTNLKVFSSQKLEIKSNLHIDQIQLKEYDFLIIPGGPYVENILIKEKNNNLKKILNITEYFAQNKKVIGAICAGPSFLGYLGLLKNHNFTCYPGYEKYIKEGKYCPTEKAITSGNFVTSRSPDTVFEFSYHLIKKLLSKK